MPHEVDKFGFPLDPELRRLEDSLEYLAAAWRTDKLQKDAEEYRQTMAYMYSLGWDGTLDIQSELPDDMMLDIYLNRHKRWGR